MHILLCAEGAYLLQEDWTNLWRKAINELKNILRLYLDDLVD